jgi:hypothetical protein
MGLANLAPDPSVPLSPQIEFPSDPRFPTAGVTLRGRVLMPPCPSAVCDVRDRVSYQAFIQMDMRWGGYRWDECITVIRVVLDDAIDLCVDFITGQGIHSSIKTTLLWLVCDAAIDPSELGIVKALMKVQRSHMTVANHDMREAVGLAETMSLIALSEG